jgi:hypothetical protein
MAGSKQKRFREHPLPPSCPPADATLIEAKVLRLVASQTPTAEHFRSCRAEGKPKPKKCDDCLWTACSVWRENTPREKLQDLAKLPNHSDKKFVATVKITKASGYTKPHTKDANHLSFWMYEEFDIMGAIEKVESL